MLVTMSTSFQVRSSQPSARVPFRAESSDGWAKVLDEKASRHAPRLAQGFRNTPSTPLSAPRVQPRVAVPDVHTSVILPCMQAWSLVPERPSPFDSGMRFPTFPKKVTGSSPVT